MNWIKCSERMPATLCEVIGWRDGRERLMQAWGDCDPVVFWDHGNSEVYSAERVTHWMPLPSPPDEQVGYVAPL